MEKTKQAMTTNEAAKLAVKLDDQGVPYKKIAKLLAREGYCSFKTGKPLGKTAVSAMIAKARNGHVFMDKKAKKYASISLRYLPRAPRKPSTSPEATPTAPKEFLPINTHLGDERVARETMTGAMETVLKRIFGIPARVLIPLDVSLRAPQA
jgi:hypothetical protein